MFPRATSFEMGVRRMDSAPSSGPSSQIKAARFTAARSA